MRIRFCVALTLIAVISSVTLPQLSVLGAARSTAETADTARWSAGRRDCPIRAATGSMTWP